MRGFGLPHGCLGVACIEDGNDLSGADAVAGLDAQFENLTHGPSGEDRGGAGSYGPGGFVSLGELRQRRGLGLNRDGCAQLFGFGLDRAWAASG
jgi:hypothetical protein